MSMLLSNNLKAKCKYLVDPEKQWIALNFKSAHRIDSDIAEVKIVYAVYV